MMVKNTISALLIISMSSCSNMRASDVTRITQAISDKLSSKDSKQGSVLGMFNGEYGTAKTVTVSKKTKLKSTTKSKSETLEELPVGKTIGFYQKMPNGWSQVSVIRNSRPLMGFVETKNLNFNETHAKLAKDNLKFSNEPYQLGYSLGFAPNKKQIEDGSIDKVLYNLSGMDLVFANREDDKISKLGMLGYLERGMIRLGSKESDTAIKDFKTVETLINERDESSVVGSTISEYADSVAEIFTGDDTISNYPGEDYELVYALNLASLAYALDGDRSSYNVARRAIDKQQKSEELFRTREIEINRSLADAKYKSTTNSQFSFNKFSDDLDSYYNKYASKTAERVKSAYVNPLGYLVTGFVQEIDSYSDASLKSNAKISYEKALELVPKNKYLSSAIKDLETESFKAEGIIYILVGSGFAPERRVVEAESPTLLGSVPLKFALAIPQNDPISKLTATVNGKSYPLEEISDNEAIVMRAERDRLSEQKLLMGSAIVKKLGLDAALLALRIKSETRALSSLLNVSRFSLDLTGNPDTRSWLSLPRKFYFARVKSGSGDKQIKIVASGSNGKTIASSSVNCKVSPLSIVYARAAGKSMYASVNSKLWIKE